jgi:small-conductance mechanosensitive channel
MMLDDVALVIDRFGELVCGWIHAWMPALGPAPASLSIRLTAAMALLVLSCLVAWLVLWALGRLVRSIPAPWDGAVRPGLPSVRAIVVAFLVLLCLAPFLWRVTDGAPPTSADGSAPIAALPAMIATWVTAAVAIIASGNLLFRMVQGFGTMAGQRADRTTSAWDDVLIETGTRLVLGFIILGTVYVAIAVLADHPVLTETTGHLLALLVIALITWALLNLVHLVDRFVMTRYRAEAGSLQARRVATQVVVLKRLAYIVITIFAVSMALMQFEAIRHVGASVLASAGLAGIILGFAAQRTLGNLLAGIQIALTQPLRIDDSVIIEKEFGKVEEITLTYVVVALWDQRRLVVPLSRIIETSFENWTRNTTELLGTVLLRCDYATPVEDLRAEAKRFVEARSEWDKRVFAVQVTDSDHRSIEVRVLVSAAAAGPLFDLRCATREHLIAWLERTHPEARPRMTLARAGQPEPPADTSPGLVATA